MSSSPVFLRRVAFPIPFKLVKGCLDEVDIETPGDDNQVEQDVSDLIPYRLTVFVFIEQCFYLCRRAPLKLLEEFRCFNGQ